jgi:hypothetical protein
MPRRRAASLRVSAGLGVVFAAAVLGACGGHPEGVVAPRSGSRPAAPAAETHPAARFVVLPPEGPTPLLLEDPDGSRRFVAFGMRVSQGADGGLTHAAELLLDLEELGAVPLPRRLGGGYLFVGHDDGETLVWKTETWTSRLIPLLRLPFETSAVVPGFDRVYAIGRRSGQVLAFDAGSGRGLDPDPLPAAPAYGAMAFADGWLAAVETDVRGPLVTFDAGMTWHPLGRVTHSPAIAAGAGETLVINTARGRFSLDATGRLARLDGSADPASSDALGVADLTPPLDTPTDEGPAWSESAKHPLRRAVLHGVPIGQGLVRVASARGHEHIRLSDGRVVSSRGVADPLEPCRPVALGLRPTYVCMAGRDTILVEVTEQQRKILQRFEGPRFVQASGNGHLIVREGCSRRQPGRYCIVSPAAAGVVTREIRVTGDVGVERVVVLTDGRVAVVVPPRFGTPPALTVVAADGAASTRTLDLTAVHEGPRALLETGMWLDTAVEVRPGTLGLWVAGGSAFVGVAIDVNQGALSAGSLREGLETTSFAGWRALSLTPGNALYETLDGGMSWSEIVVPGRLAQSMRAELSEGPRARRERGCSRVGCVFGEWVRIGWQARGESSLAEAAARPPPVPQEAVFANWALRCDFSGRVSRRVLGQSPVEVRDRTPTPRISVWPAPRVAADPAPVALESSAFRPFLGHAPPSLAPGDLAFDFGTEEQLIQVRGYVWGPRGVPWDRRGRWIVRGVDRFDVDAVWTTRPTRSPWPDALSAAARFGSDPSHRTITDWQVHMDPSGQSGLLIIRVQGAVELFSISSDRVITPIADPDGLGLEHPTGVVVVENDLYIGSAPSSRVFRVARNDHGVLRLVGTYPRHAEAPPPRLVRGTSHNALGILGAAVGPAGKRGGGGSWVLFPVDGRSGEALLPIIVPRAALSRLPRACGPDDEGWLVEHTVSRSIARAELAESGQALPVTDLDARLIVNDGDVCVRALATGAAGGPLDEAKLRRPVAGEPRPISLVVTDRAADRRFGFRCSG